MSTSPLQTLLDSIVAQCVALKGKDGVTVPHIIIMATSAFKGLYSVSALSADEKKAFIFMALQKGVAAAGSLQGLVKLDPALESQVLHMAVNTVFAFAEAYPQVVAGVDGVLSYIRSCLSKVLPGCSQVAAVAATLDPKDGALIEQAVAALKALTTPVPSEAALVPSEPAPLEIRNVESTQESVVSAE